MKITGFSRTRWWQKYRANMEHILAHYKAWGSKKSKFHKPIMRRSQRHVISAWNKYFASVEHRVRQSALRAGHSKFVPVFCIRYTIEIQKAAGHCDRQKANPVGHTWNSAGQWPITSGYKSFCPSLGNSYTTRDHKSFLTFLVLCK